MASPDHSTTNPIIEWLSSQWFFLSALVLGAGHAATAQAKITRHEEQLKKLDNVNVELATLKQNQNHHSQMLERILNKLDKGKTPQFEGFLISSSFVFSCSFSGSVTLTDHVLVPGGKVGGFPAPSRFPPRFGFSLISKTAPMQI